MPIEFIEIEQEVTPKGNAVFYSGKVSREAMDKLERSVILRTREAGRIKSQIFMVKGSAADIAAVVASDPSVKRYHTKSLMQRRGLEVRMGTPPLTRIEELADEWETELNFNIKSVVHTPSGKTIYLHMKEDLPHIPSNAIQCNQCQQLNSRNATICSNCSADLDQYGTRGQEPFSILRWKEP